MIRKESPVRLRTKEIRKSRKREEEKLHLIIKAARAARPAPAARTTVKTVAKPVAAKAAAPKPVAAKPAAPKAPRPKPAAPAPQTPSGE